MANNNKNYDKSSLDGESAAAERPGYTQPTMYDHFENFKQFKEAKEQEEYARQQSEALSQLNPNFTNFNASANPDNQMSSSHHLSRFRQQQTMMDRKYHLVNMANQLISEKRELRQKEGAVQIKSKTEALLSLNRAPIQCPVNTCKRTIGVSSVLSHYLRDHYDLQCQEILPKKSVIYRFSSENMALFETNCIGVLSYGNENRKNCPAERNICVHNSFLPKSHEHMSAHLPIIVMSCRTMWTAYMNERNMIDNMKEPTNPYLELLVLWLSSIETTKPINCTLTVFDVAMTTSRSSILQIRNLNDSQDTRNFLTDDCNVLRLTYGDLATLSKNFTECIYVEIMINEYADDSEDASPKP